jgi:hypothetical protein
MTESVNRILPLPYLPTYIARFVWNRIDRLILLIFFCFFFSRPNHSKLNAEVRTESFNPIFASNWQKASDNYAAKHRNIYGSSYINIELESNQTVRKQYDTYKPSYYPQYDLNSIVCC